MRYSLLFFLFMSFLITTHKTRAQEQKEDYNSVVAMANDYFDDKDYINAKAAYQYASRLNPEAEFAKARLNQTIELLRQQLAKSGTYTEYVSQADEYMAQQEYDKAIEAFKKAQEIIPDIKYPAEKIRDIKKLQVEFKERTAEYNRTLAKANKLMEEKNFAEARTAFEEAAEIFPSKSYPQEKIEEIDNIMYQLEQAENGYNMAMSNARFFMKKGKLREALEEYKNANSFKPGEKEPVEKIAGLQDKIAESEQFSAHVEEADRLYIVKDYRGAREQYAQAQKIKPNDNYLKEMMLKIERALEDKNTSIEQDYTNAITRGDEFLNNKDLKLAKTQFEYAARLKPGESLPNQKLEEVNSLLAEYQNKIETADQKLENGDFEEAKSNYMSALQILPAESYPKEQLEEVNIYLARESRKDEIDSAYAEIIAMADQMFVNNRFAEAKIKYKEALDVKPGETYPKAKIDEVEETMASLYQEKAARENYSNLISMADQLFENEEFESAQQKYEEAAKVLPEEEYPGHRIEEIEQITADMAAYKNKRKKYKSYVETADELFETEELKQSKINYQEALGLFPGESYPQSRIAEIDTIFAEIQRQKEIDSTYHDALAKGDQFMEEEKYKAAKQAFLEAKQLKPDADAPSEKLKKVEAVLLEIEQQRQLEAKYEALVQKGDSLIEANEYPTAKVAFEEALAIKTEAEYPRQQLIEVERELKKIEEERQQAYDRAISKGDNAFQQEDYYQAKEAYQAASKLYPKNEYPINQIDKCNSYIAEIEKATEREYNQSIANGDKFYNSKIYDRALDAFYRASELRPKATYPSEMIDKITNILSKNILVEIDSAADTILSNKMKKYKFEPIGVQDRKDNYVIITAKNLSQEEFKVIMSYGSKGAKNGGMLVRVPASETEKELIIRFGTQYKWFSEDNDWISIVPEGGKLQVSNIKIVKAE
ncbi:MAG: hypothetical protein K9G58_15100 [Bacteroidales bacterium]|nr:hypothetical protein [Bacteroidales bacterium]MCF8399499.1 hypothetical protein [Bacteroidales bacterium]